MPLRRAGAYLALFALIALVLAPAPCDAQTTKQARSRAASRRSASAAADRPVVDDASRKYVSTKRPNAHPPRCFKDGSPCLAVDGYDDGNPCTGPYGTCVDGTCEEVNRDEGCPCGDDLTDPSKCGADLTDPCVNGNQPCKCDGQGACVINYLPDGTICDDFPLTDPCKQAKQCSGNVCTDNGAKVGAACTTTDAPADCANVGVCNANGVCDGLNCRDPNQCANKGQSCERKDCCSGLSCLDIDGNKKCCPQTCGEGHRCCPGFICQNGMCVQESCDDGACTRSCGSGNGDCDVACRAVNPNAVCLGQSGNQKCRCNNQGGGTQFECANFPNGFKCCTCTTPE